MNTTYPQKTTLRCRECGSFLLLIDKKTEVEEGQFAPVTTSIYHCSDAVCQEKIDNKTAQRIQAAHDQEEARKKRRENIQRNRLQNKVQK